MLKKLEGDPQDDFINVVCNQLPALAVQRASYKAHLAERDGYIGWHIIDQQNATRLTMIFSIANTKVALNEGMGVTKAAI